MNSVMMLTESSVLVCKPRDRLPIETTIFPSNSTCVQLDRPASESTPRVHRAAEGGERACNMYRRRSAICYQI